MVGCSVTKEVTTEETTTVQSIAVDVPKVEGKFNIPKVRTEITVDKIPEEIFQTIQVIKTTDPISGKTTKATIDIKQTRKKDSKGESFLDTELKVKQEPIKTDAAVTKKKVDSTTKTESFFVMIWNDIKWWVLGLLIICVLSIIILKKFFPTLIKTYLKI
jgi:hypothetical protein